MRGGQAKLLHLREGIEQLAAPCKTLLPSLDPEPGLQLARLVLQKLALNLAAASFAPHKMEPRGCTATALYIVVSFPLGHSGNMSPCWTYHAAWA